MDRIRKFKNKKICIVSNDAGGAEILRSLTSSFQGNFKFLLSGPALKIFSKKKKFFDIKKTIKSCDVVFTGTSSKSDLEYNAIEYCNSIDKKVYSFLDHWVNYKKRFIRKNRVILPNKIILGDKFAMEIAKKLFKNIFYFRNPYWKEIKKKIKKKNYRALDTILFVSSNIDRLNNKKYNDKYILNKCLNYIDSHKKIKKIIIRPHPSEQKTKYKNIISGKIKVEFDKNKTLIKSFNKAGMVCGHNSMAMVVGKICGLKSININLKRIRNTIPLFYIDKSI
jgi:hypothetical protein